MAGSEYSWCDLYILLHGPIFHIRLPDCNTSILFRA